MKKYIISCTILFIISFITMFFTSCRRDWIIEIDGYTIHEIDGEYHIADIPVECKEKSEYIVPTKIGDYNITGFGSTRSVSILGGPHDMFLGGIRKLYIPKEIKSTYFHSMPILIETEELVSSINWNAGLDDYYDCYFLSPKEELDINFVDSLNCYDGLIYDIKDDGYAKVIFNYSDNYVIHDKFNDLIVNEISYSAFAYSNIESLVIPDNITIINDYAFENSSLKSLVFPNSPLIIGKNAFENCKIEELDFGNSNIEIKEDAFSGNKLKTIVITENVSKIGQGAFSYNEIESFSINNNMTLLPDGIFKGNPLTGELDFGDKINKIGDDALSYNNRIKLTIPEGTSFIGKIRRCENLEILVLPNNKIITPIDFVESLDNLKEIHLGGATNFSFIKSNARFDNLNTITVSDTNENLYVLDGILYEKETKAIVKCPAQLNIEEIVINVKPYYSAFKGCIYLKKAEINTQLSESLFSSCKNLEKVILNSNIKEIPKYSFIECDKLKEINLDNVIKINELAFYGCDSLNYVNLAKCEEVDEQAFKLCDLREVTFTKNIKKIGSSAFANNKNLKKCNYYDALVEDNSFYDTPLYVKTDEDKELEREEWIYRLSWIFPWLLNFLII